jgi:hypothetical protein
MITTDDLIFGAILLVCVMYALAYLRGSRPANADARAHERFVQTDEKRYELEVIKDARNEERYKNNKAASDHLIKEQAMSIRRQEDRKGCWANREVIKMADEIIVAVDLSNGISHEWKPAEYDGSEYC